MKLSVDLTNHQFLSIFLISSRYTPTCFTRWSGFTYSLKWRKCRLQPTDNGLTMNEVVMAKDQILAMERLLEFQGGVNLCVLKAQTTGWLGMRLWWLRIRSRRCRDYWSPMEEWTCVYWRHRQRVFQRTYVSSPGAWGTSEPSSDSLQYRTRILGELRPECAEPHFWHRRHSYSLR